VTGASDELANHILSGAPADLFLTADPSQVTRLEHAGLVQSGSGVVVACNGLAAVGGAGGPALRSATDLLRPAVQRIALAEPGCPLGAYTRAYLEPKGLWEAVQARAIFLDNPAVVLEAVRAGRAEAGLVYQSDAAGAVGCRLLFRVKSAPVHYVGVLTRRGDDKPGAHALLDFMTSSAAIRRFRDSGFLPVSKAC
jgi:molybdate transport system substrate-binding protein